MKPPPYVPQPNCLETLRIHPASGRSSPLASSFNSYLYNTHEHQSYSKCSVVIRREK
ncbi:hypothetical protein GBAR_LOCUS22448 [Geodia barretti]|uniref:Uncharacterized protein n=1 Tax=Geodia barretti TaxID=519541 RepID=A0AA35X788_GEOBA|nr:hypothetical protein GBAR_LOCUS22448 [Geodia barretti]